MLILIYNILVGLLYALQLPQLMVVYVSIVNSANFDIIYEVNKV